MSFNVRCLSDFFSSGVRVARYVRTVNTSSISLYLGWGARFSNSPIIKHTVRGSRPKSSQSFGNSDESAACAVFKVQ